MKSQAFSMDIMIAVIIFMGTIFIFYSIISGGEESKIDELEDDASIVMENIATEDSAVRITEGIAIDEEKLEELLGMDYSEIKKKLRVENDFCIFLEDGEGNIIYLEAGQPGIGSDKIKVSDVPCG